MLWKDILLFNLVTKKGDKVALEDRVMIVEGVKRGVGLVECSLAYLQSSKDLLSSWLVSF